MRNFNLASVIYEPKKFFAFTLTLFGLLPLLIVSLSSFGTQALTIQSSRDCDSNAVIRCGARNFDELQTRYSQPDVAEIFSSFGISDQDIANIRSTAVEGQVTRGGDVIVNDQVVAKDAMTAGRQNIAGSTAMTSNGVTFFRRPPSVSFLSSSEPAFVVMDGGTFKFAIIASCGNPVIATPVVKTQSSAMATSRAQSLTTPTQPTPTITNTNTNTNNNTNNNTVTTPAPVVYTYTAPTNTTPTTQAPAQTSATTTAAAAAPTYTAPSTQAAPAPAASSSSPSVGKSLPNTGPGDVLKLSGTAMILSTVGHLFYQRRRLQGPSL